MDTMVAFANAQSARAAGNPLKKLDWDKLKEYVNKNKNGIESVYAGLSEDWEWTGDEVYSEEEGWIEPNGAYTSSIWATPIAFIFWKSGYDGIDEFKEFVLEENE